LAEDDTLTTARLIAAMYSFSTDISGGGLDTRPVDSLITASEEDRVIVTMSTRERGPVITKEILAKRWGIGLDTAHETLTATTQQGIRRGLHPVERRYRTRQSHLRFPTLNTRFYTDTLFSTSKSLRGIKCAQIFTNGTGYHLFYPMRKKSEAEEALNEMIRAIGVPKDLVSDGTGEETGGCIGKPVKEYKIKHGRTGQKAVSAKLRVESGVRRFGHDLQSGSGIVVESDCHLSGNSQHTIIFHPLAAESQVKSLEGLLHPTFPNTRNSTGMYGLGFMT
jgi:hypothetical protein